MIWLILIGALTDARQHLIHRIDRAWVLVSDCIRLVVAAGFAVRCQHDLTLAHLTLTVAVWRLDLFWLWQTLRILRIHLNLLLVTGGPLRTLSALVVNILCILYAFSTFSDQVLKMTTSGIVLRHWLLLFVLWRLFLTQLPAWFFAFFHDLLSRLASSLLVEFDRWLTVNVRRFNLFVILARFPRLALGFSLLLAASLIDSSVGIVWCRLLLDWRLVLIPCYWHHREIVRLLVKEVTPLDLVTLMVYGKRIHWLIVKIY